MAEDEPAPGPPRVEPLGAPADPLRPTGRVDRRQTSPEAKARMAARMRRIQRALALGLIVVVVLAVLVLLAAGMGSPQDP